MNEERLSCRSELHASRLPHKELGLQLILKRCELARQRWLREMKPACSGRHRALLGDRDEGLQLIETHAKNVAGGAIRAVMLFGYGSLPAAQRPSRYSLSVDGTRISQSCTDSRNIVTIAPGKRTRTAQVTSV